ncbi:MAG: hypothetical protein KGD64_10190 [Candidatus Heimdallarchaeota archaeon]|nr:hypothetical protein [Candidatus Heimdallarchaeota archaeon]
MTSMQIPALVLMIESILLLGYSIYTFIQAIRLTKNVAYIHILAGIVLGLVTNICISVASFYTIVSDLVIVYMIIANISISLSILSIFNGMIMIREDKLPIYSYIAALIVGATIILVSSIERSQLQYDFNAIWSVKYDSVLIPIMISISSLLLGLHFVLNSTRKIRRIRNNKKIDLSLVAFLLLAFWIITSFIDSMKVVRMFVLPIVFFLLALTLLSNPLGLLVTNIPPEEIILVSRFSQPLIRLDLREKKIVRELEEIQLLLAGKKIISESLKSAETPKTLKMKAKEIKVVEMKNFSCIVIGRKVDGNCISATYTAFGKFNSKTNLDYLESTSVLNERDEKLFLEIFLDHFKRIDATIRRD